MKIHERYTIGRMLHGFLLVLFVLAVLFSLTSLLDELKDVGQGRYAWPDAFLFVAQTVPHRILDLVPLAALLGGILALGTMGDANELVAIRAMGVSAWRFALTALKAGAVFTLGALLVAEFVAPPLQKSADTRRTMAIHDTGALRVERGFWFRDGNRFVKVAQVLPGRRLADVVIYEFDEEGRLRQRTRASEAVVEDSGRWLLQGVRREILAGDEIRFVDEETAPWESSFGPAFVDLTLLAPESLSISDLFLYVQSMRERGQVDESYRLRLWRLLGLPLSTGAMLLLAIPFTFALGGSSSGLRMALGCMVGAAGYALDRIGGHIGMLGGVSAVLTALAPGAIILVVAAILMRRVR
ncbi:MAG: LPS export ABC transporter permease LptG [Planctomycetota bacterium]|nr:MAG: LPS export ABC transporter permease LptG [Planctomycetota bacterium]